MKMTYYVDLQQLVSQYIVTDQMIKQWFKMICLGHTDETDEFVLFTKLISDYVDVELNLIENDVSYRRINDTLILEIKGKSGEFTDIEDVRDYVTLTLKLGVTYDPVFLHRLGIIVGESDE